MGAPDLLRQLHDAGFMLALADGGGIRITPGSALTDEHVEAIRTHKPELIALLTKPTPIIAAPVMPLPSGVTGAAVSDAWCWPQSDAMNGGEIDTFTKRLHLFARRGIGEAQADKLADLLVIRDRQLDDRRLCLECSHLGDRGRCLAAAAGRLPGVDRRLEPVPDLLQRCPAFGLRKGMEGRDDMNTLDRRLTDRAKRMQP